MLVMLPVCQWEMRLVWGSLCYVLTRCWVLSLWGIGKICIHSSFQILHLRDFIGYVVTRCWVILVVFDEAWRLKTYSLFLSSPSCSLLHWHLPTSGKQICLKKMNNLTIQLILQFVVSFFSEKMSNIYMVKGVLNILLSYWGNRVDPIACTPYIIFIIYLQLHQS